MVLSMLDQMFFALGCGHNVVLGRLNDWPSWTCETCGKLTDLSVDPTRELLANELDTANQIDFQRRAKGVNVVRAE